MNHRDGVRKAETSSVSKCSNNMDVENQTRFVFPFRSDSPSSPGAGSEFFSDTDHSSFVNAARAEPKMFPESAENSYFGVGTLVDETCVQVLAAPSAEARGATSEGYAARPGVLEPTLRSFSAAPVTRAEIDDRTLPPSAVVINNRFELIELVGVGGMGAVYKAADRRKLEANDRDPYVAIKVLNDDFRHHPDAFISLQREARKSQTLAHPHIVNVYDFDRDGDTVFMTMEFLRGAPLDALLRERAGRGLPPAQALSVLRDIVGALIHAHAHNIVHSDLKPGNIYVTADKGAKVFDFGISRAVNPPGYRQATADSRTLFDAGTLGALTPAYASLEMLQGEEPAPGDDVYALACIAYEMYCGRHPFDKTPADQAMQQRRVPKRIPQLSRRQWRALKQALEFTRDKRTATVTDFFRQFYGKTRIPVWTGLVPLVVLTVVIGAYSSLPQPQVVDEILIKEELQEELQQTLTRTRAADRLATIERMLQVEEASVRWETDLKTELSAYQQLLPADTGGPVAVQQQVAEKWLAAARLMLNRNDADGVERALARASAWGAAPESVEEIRERQEQKLVVEQARLARIQDHEQRQLQAAEQTRRQQLRQQEVETRNRQLTAAIARIENALHCSASMDISGTLARHWQALSQLDKSLARQLLPDVSDDLRNCLVHLQQTQPQKAEALLEEAKALFPAADALRTLRIDHCAHLQPGTGGGGARFSCQDKLASGGQGPPLVMIEAPGSGKVAIGKYEISAADMKTFCVRHGDCGALGRLAPHAPVNNLPLTLVAEYLRWLSAESGYHYRLPGEREWLAAAGSANAHEDPDRNCHLRFGAIHKGSELVAVTTGKTNANGLMNVVGNVQEWALGGDGTLLAMGGSREDPMSRCLVTTRRLHDGSPDPVTGFRVVREL